MLAPGRLSSLLSESSIFSVALGGGRGSTHALRARRRADPGFAARLGRGQLAMGGALALRLAERLRLSSTDSVAGGWTMAWSTSRPPQAHARPTTPNTHRHDH